MKKCLVICCLLVCILNPIRGWCSNPLDDLLYPPSPLTEKERSTLGAVGLAQAYFMPEAEFEAFAKGKGSGTAKGAAQGFMNAMAHMGNCSGDFCGLAIIIWAATAGTVGTVHGAIQGYMDALPAEEAQKVEQSLNKLYSSLKLQGLLNQKIMKAGQAKAAKNLVSIKGFGPKVPGEKVDYLPLHKNPVDSVLESSVITFGFQTWPRELKPPKGISVGGKDPSLALFVNTRPRLVRLSDNKTIYHPHRDTSTRFLKSSEWEANNFNMFFKNMESLMETLADRIVEDIFITYVLPRETPP